MTDYTWVDWLKALATMIAENGERYLAERARAVDWQKDDVPLLAYGDENIDPMSFLYFLAQRNTTHQFEGIFRSVHDVFDIALDFPNPSLLCPPRQRSPRRCSTMGNRFDRICSGVCSGRRRQSTKGPPSSRKTSMLSWDSPKLE